MRCEIFDYVKNHGCVYIMEHFGVYGNFDRTQELHDNPDPYVVVTPWHQPTMIGNGDEGIPLIHI